jgi:predicted nucleic acid-binding Zn ribbon protein
VDYLINFQTATPEDPLNETRTFPYLYSSGAGIGHSEHLSVFGIMKQGTTFYVGDSRDSCDRGSRRTRVGPPRGSSGQAISC